MHNLLINLIVPSQPAFYNTNVLLNTKLLFC